MKTDTQPANEAPQPDPPIRPLFPLGQIVATPAASSAFERNHQTPLEFLHRHTHGDWGDLAPSDQAANDHAVSHSERLLSAYRLKDGTKIWVITEADRSSTCALLPEEY